MGKASNKVCIGMDITTPPPKQMAVDVGAGVKVIPLNFGTYFGACFSCNKFGHFARDCPNTRKEERTGNKRASEEGNIQAAKVIEEKGARGSQGRQEAQREASREVVQKEPTQGAQEQGMDLTRLIAKSSKVFAASSGVEKKGQISSMRASTIEAAKPKVVSFKRVKSIARTKDIEKVITEKGKEKVLHHSPHKKGKGTIPLHNAFQALQGVDLQDLPPDIGALMDVGKDKDSSDVEEFIPLSQ